MTALVLGSVLLAWAAVVAVVGVVAVLRGLRHQRRARPERLGGDLPRVVVLRPCAGDEPGLAPSLASTVSLRYRGPLRVIFGTTTATDPARPVVQRAAASLRARGLGVRVGVFGPRGPNLKSSQLAGMLDDADDDIVLVVDSDVDLRGLNLDRLLAPLHGEGSKTAAVWCPPVERTPTRLGDRMSAALLGGSMHAFPLLGALDPGGLVGKTFAVRMDALRDVGGFGALTRTLGEDMELARRLRANGWQTTMGHATVTSLASGRGVGEVLARYARWLMVIRAQRPALLASYPLLLAATPLLLFFGALGVAFGLPGAGVTLGLALGARMLVVAGAMVLTARPLGLGRMLHDALLADVLLLAAFGRAAAGPARVQWRGRRLRLGPHGRLMIDEESARGRHAPSGAMVGPHAGASMGPANR